MVSVHKGFRAKNKFRKVKPTIMIKASAPTTSRGLHLMKRCFALNREVATGILANASSKPEIHLLLSNRPVSPLLLGTMPAFETSILTLLLFSARFLNIIAFFASHDLAKVRRRETYQAFEMSAQVALVCKAAR